MRFLVDAQLPRRLASWLAGQGHDAIHTLNLPDGNRTTDEVVCSIADIQDRVVVTKDDLVSTGNISNTDLLAIFERQWPALERAFADYSYVELTQEGLLGHE